MRDTSNAFLFFKRPEKKTKKQKKNTKYYVNHRRRRQRHTSKMAVAQKTHAKRRLLIETIDGHKTYVFFFRFSFCDPRRDGGERCGYNVHTVKLDDSQKPPLESTTAATEGIYLHNTYYNNTLAGFCGRRRHSPLSPCRQVSRYEIARVQFEFATRPRQNELCARVLDETILIQDEK